MYVGAAVFCLLLFHGGRFFYFLFTSDFLRLCVCVFTCVFGNFAFFRPLCFLGVVLFVFAGSLAWVPGGPWGVRGAGCGA